MKEPDLGQTLLFLYNKWCAFGCLKIALWGCVQVHLRAQLNAYVCMKTLTVEKKNLKGA